MNATENKAPRGRRGAVQLPPGAHAIMRRGAVASTTSKSRVAFASLSAPSATVALTLKLPVVGGRIVSEGPTRLPNAAACQLTGPTPEGASAVTHYVASAPNSTTSGP